MRLALKVIPKAGRDQIDGPVDTPSGQCLKLRVTAPPDDGKANKAVVTLLAKTWGISKSALNIVIGETARTKVIEIQDENAQAKARLWLQAQGMDAG